MLEIAIIIAFIGSLIASILDLKTTEFPEDIPYLMIALGIFIWYIYALTFGSFIPLFLSLLIGVIVGLLGIIAYRVGVWGDGDSAILAAIVFLVPSISFLVDFLFNFLIVSIIYLLTYTIAIGYRKNLEFYKEIKKNLIFIILYVAILPIILIATYFLLPILLIPLALLWFAGLGMIFFTLYAKKIEKNLFRKSVSSKELKPGDVLANSKKWVGLSEEDIKKIQKTQKHVEIKDGVRFTLVFPITIALTALLGNVLFLLL